MTRRTVQVRIIHLASPTVHAIILFSFVWWQSDWAGVYLECYNPAEGVMGNQVLLL